MAVADSLKVSPDYDDDETTHSSNSNWPLQNTKKQTNEKENESEGAKKKLKPDVATKDRLNDIETNELNECARYQPYIKKLINFTSLWTLKFKIRPSNTKNIQELNIINI